MSAAPQPLRAPIAATKPCRQCTVGKAKGRNLLCDACRKENGKQSNREWAVKRNDVLAMKREVAELKSTVAHLQQTMDTVALTLWSQLRTFGCRVRVKEGKG